MKKQENNLIEKQLKEKKKLPGNIKQEINKNVFRNLFAGIIVLLYFIFINLGYYNIASNAFLTDIKIFSICLIAITVILFERAYNESNSKLGIHGIETLLISIITLFMQYVFFYQKQNFIKIYMTIPVFFSIYYVLKCIVITARAKRKYSKNISDVKDIIKKEKKKIEEDEIIEDKEVIAEKTKDSNKENEVIEKKETKPKTTKTTKSTKTSDTKKTTKKTTTSKKNVEVQDNEETKTAETKKAKTTTKTRTTSSRKKTDLQDDEENKKTKTTTKPRTTTKKDTTKKDTTPKEKTTTTTKRTRTIKEE